MCDDTTGRALSRRRLLALAGTGALGSAAGCGGAGTSDGNGDDETTTGTRTGTATPTTTDAPPVESQGPRVVERACDGDVLQSSPAAHFAPTDGWAAPTWLDGTVSVAVVTNLAASGEGSLRWAANRDGPCVVVFEVGGVVDLAGDHLEIESDQCWIAGQTAPSPGITLIRGGLYVGGNDCVIQHLRVRAGDAGRTSDWEPDTAHTADGTVNNIFDHVTATWGVDETLSVGYDTRDTTLSNCLVAEGLDESTHHKGGHSAGTLVGDRAKNVALLGNLYYANVHRNPLMKYDTTNVLVNNLVTWWGSEGALLLDTTEAAFVGNAYVNAADPYDPVIRRAGEAYFEDNVTTAYGSLTEGISHLAEKPLWPDDLEALPSDETQQHVQRNAGARPADRTPHDQRVVDQTRAEYGEFIDSQEEVAGYPDLETTERPLEIPEAGLADWLSGHTEAVEVAGASSP